MLLQVYVCKYLRSTILNIRYISKKKNENNTECLAILSLLQPLCSRPVQESHEC